MSSPKSLERSRRRLVALVDALTANGQFNVLDRGGTGLCQYVHTVFSVTGRMSGNHAPHRTDRQGRGGQCLRDHAQGTRSHSSSARRSSTRGSTTGGRRRHRRRGLSCSAFRLKFFVETYVGVVVVHLRVVGDPLLEKVRMTSVSLYLLLGRSSQKAMSALAS